jgi:hypothetical protein
LVKGGELIDTLRAAPYSSERGGRFDLREKMFCPAYENYRPEIISSRYNTGKAV